MRYLRRPYFVPPWAVLLIACTGCASAPRPAGTAGKMTPPSPISPLAGQRDDEPALRSRTDTALRAPHGIEQADYANEEAILLPLPDTGAPDGAPLPESAGIDVATSADACPPKGFANLSKGHFAKRLRKDEKSAIKALGIRSPHKANKAKRDIGSNPCVPRELRMASHPLYIVEPPDVLYIEAIESLPNRPIAGERLVRQDGTISLGYYGQIHVTGLTIAEIEQKIRDRLSDYVQDPQVYVDVAAFNSKVFYVVGQVQQAGRLPITGNETVLDALALAGGPTNFASLKKLHVARPNPGGGCDQVLWVDYYAIAHAGDTRTNYQLLPGDRVVLPPTKGFVVSVFFDNVLPPFERLAGLGALLRYTFGQQF